MTDRETDPQLFAVDLTPLGTEDRSGKKPSPDRARTERRKIMLERGQHPTGNGAIDLNHNCRECAHCIVKGYDRKYYKCDVSPLGESRSAASDIRLSWPACLKFQRR